MKTSLQYINYSKDKKCHIYNLKLIKKEYKDLFNHLDTYIEASKPTETFDLDSYNDLIQKQRKHLPSRIRAHISHVG